MSASSDLVLYASFLQNRQQEKSNKSFRLVQELLTGKGDASLLTQNLELSLTELKDANLMTSESFGIIQPTLLSPFLIL